MRTSIFAATLLFLAHSAFAQTDALLIDGQGNVTVPQKLAVRNTVTISNNGTGVGLFVGQGQPYGNAVIEADMPKSGSNLMWLAIDKTPVFSVTAAEASASTMRVGKGGLTVNGDIAIPGMTYHGWSGWDYATISRDSLHKLGRGVDSRTSAAYREVRTAQAFDHRRVNALQVKTFLDGDAAEPVLGLFADDASRAGIRELVAYDDTGAPAAILQHRLPLFLIQEAQALSAALTRQEQELKELRELVQRLGTELEQLRKR